MDTETGHFERKFVDESTWEVVSDDYLLSHGGTKDIVNNMLDNPMTEYRLNAFAFYRWVEEGG